MSPVVEMAVSGGTFAIWTGELCIKKREGMKLTYGKEQK